MINYSNQFKYSGLLEDVSELEIYTTFKFELQGFLKILAKQIELEFSYRSFEHSLISMEP